MGVARIAAFTLPALAGLALALAPSGDGAAQRITPDPNPCTDPVQRAQLLCPRISLDKPRDMYYDRRHGRRVLRARNSINSVGLGPIEFRGRRSGPNTMNAVQ